jgi:hypothetical protein
MTEPTKPPLPNYLVAQMALHKAGAFPPGSLTIGTVYHDDWCAQINGKGPCDCAPDMEFQVVDPGSTDASN